MVDTVTRRLRREWWVLQWLAVGLVLAFMTFRVQRVGFAIPGGDARIVFDFDAAYTRPGWRMAIFLVVCAIALLWSWQQRSGGGR